MSSKCIKLLKQGSDSGAKPVFILPVVSGTTGCFDNLIGSCDKFKRTVYGLTDPYLTGEQASMNLPTREMVSKYYVEAIMSKQSKGPYTLMGYSQGGQWTWAVADVLINDKKQVVEQMVLLDPVYPTWDHGERCYNWMPVRLLASRRTPQRSHPPPGGASLRIPARRGRSESIRQRAPAAGCRRAAAGCRGKAKRAPTRATVRTARRNSFPSWCLPPSSSPSSS